jgi:hypothetical protein
MRTRISARECHLTSVWLSNALEAFPEFGCGTMNFVVLGALPRTLLSIPDTHLLHELVYRYHSEPASCLECHFFAAADLLYVSVLTVHFLVSFSHTNITERKFFQSKKISLWLFKRRLY